MVEVLVSAESDKLVIRSLRLAVLSAWFMILVQVANVVINLTRSCPTCPACTGPAEKP